MWPCFSLACVLRVGRRKTGVKQPPRELRFGGRGAERTHRAVGDREEIAQILWEGEAVHLEIRGRLEAGEPPWEAGLHGWMRGLREKGARAVTAWNSASPTVNLSFAQNCTRVHVRKQGRRWESGLQKEAGVALGLCSASYSVAWDNLLHFCELQRDQP